jgi:hypothetical protein
MEVEMGRVGNIRTHKEVPHSFRELLPTLMTPGIGGTSFHQAVGAWMRSNRIAGLVFPSSRRNARTASEGLEVTDFDGWNFVDYRDSPIVDYERLFGLQPDWLREEDTGIQLADWLDDGNKRAWRIQGAEEGERRRYDLEWEVLAGRRTPSLVWDTRFGAREQ